MTRQSLSLLLLSALLAGGCADSNDSAPEVVEAHPQGWIFVHAEQARNDASRCQPCHGLEFQGNGEAVSCYSCHFTAPADLGNFAIHPPEWGADVIAGHQTFPEGYSWTACANGACHGEDLRGGLLGPSCFLAVCHPQGPPRPDESPPKDYVHTVGAGGDRTYFLPENHGPDAQNLQIVCRNCHGRPPRSFDGGFVADPRILNFGAVGNCSAVFCHPAAKAHPTNWQGTDDTDQPGRLGAGYLASHWDIAPSAVAGCSLCHAIQPGALSPEASAPSCFAPAFTNAEGSSTTCHPAGPSLLGDD